MTGTPSSPCITPRALVCILLIIALGFSLGFTEFIVIGIQSELAGNFGVSLAQTGLLISAFSVTYAIATPVLALGTGRIRRRVLLIWYAALFCVGNAASLTATTFEMLLIARVLAGLVSGALLAVAVTYIPELVRMDRISMCISLVYAAFSVAMVISTSFGKYVAATTSWRYAMVAALVLSLLVSGALIAALPREGASDAPATAREQLPLLLDTRMLAAWPFSCSAWGRSTCSTATSRRTSRTSCT